MAKFPFLRRYQYIEDYFYTVNELYADRYVASYPVTYYSLDTENTVWDDVKINAGSYEKLGVGELSGVVWKKIQLLPVFGVEPISFNPDSGEKGGITLKESASTNIVFTSLYGLIPSEGDVVDLSFGYKKDNIIMKMLYTVNNINLAHQNEYLQIYQLQLRMAPFNVDELEKQISSDWIFYDHDQIIVPLENGRLLLQLQENSTSLVSSTNDLFDRSGYYLYEVTDEQLQTPVIQAAYFTGGYPSGQTELKEDDEFDFYVRSNVAITEIEFDGSSDDYATQSENITFDSSTYTTITSTIADRGTTSQLLPARVRVKSLYGYWSDWFTTNSSSDVNGTTVVNLNNTYPVITIGDITYPVGQHALKSSETATIANTISAYDTVSYSSPTSELSIVNSSVFESDKTVSRISGTYNVTTNNFTITATRSANNAVSIESTVVYIANAGTAISVTTPVDRLRSGGNDGTTAQNHVITITSSQYLVSAPVLTAPAGTWLGAAFTGGPYTWTRTLQVHDDDIKGVYEWSVSSFNLSGFETTTISEGTEYELGGFVSRDITLLGFTNEVEMNVEAVDYDKVTLSWEVKDLPIQEDVGTSDTPPIPNAWCLDSLNTNPTIIRILDTPATEAISQNTTITIEESV